MTADARRADVSVLRIEIAGSRLAEELEPLFLRACVEDSLNLPDLFVLEFRDPGRIVLTRAHAEIGAPVTLRVINTAHPAGELLLTGEVTAVEVEYDPLGTRTIIRGYDRSHRLFRGRATETYRNQTAADIARRVAQRVGLRPGRIDAAPTVLAHVSQVNETDWQFLSRLAREIGHEVAVREGELDFRRPSEASTGPASGSHESTDPLQLSLGTNLQWLRAGINSAQQVCDVEVRSWDPTHNRALVGRAHAATRSAQPSVGPADVAARFGSPVRTEVTTPFGTQAEADAAAIAVAEQVADTYALFEGQAEGSPRLRAGRAVSLGLVGAPFDGRYVLTTTRHCFDRDGYSTSFSVTGHQEQSLLNLSSAGIDSTLGSTSRPLYGVFPGIVTDNRDPDDLWRVRLRFPWLAERYESDWARVCVLNAGEHRGFEFMPEVDDEVLVAFEHGDVRRPYVIGGLHNGTNRPAHRTGGVLDRSTGAVRHTCIRSKTGSELAFYDDANRNTSVILSYGRASEEAFTLDTTRHEVVIQSNGARGEIRIMARGPVRIEAGGDLDLRATGTLNLRGAAVNIEADAAVALRGNPIRLN